MEKISDIIESIANEKGLDIQNVKERVLKAIISTAKKIYGFEHEYEASIDPTSKAVSLFKKIEVVSNNDERIQEGSNKVIKLEDAKKVDADIEIGDTLNYELEMDNLGRTAVATLHKELEFHIQQLLGDQIFEKYNALTGQLVFGTVLQIDSDENTYIEIDEIRAILPRKYRIKGEKFKVGQVVKAVIRKVFIDKSKSIKVELSRTSPKFLEALLALEVPEIKDGLVIIHSSARIPGERAKVALIAATPNVDAVGATVGIKGVRINAVSKELHGENIDAIEYTNEPVIFIARAMSPAIVSSVKINNTKAIISLNSEQRSKAIGKSGINIRLASMITGYEIELNDLNDTKTKEYDAQENGLAGLKALFGE